jgi:hypothetical protein
MVETYTFQLPEIDHGQSIPYYLTVTKAEARTILDAEPGQRIALRDDEFLELKDDGAFFLHCPPNREAARYDSPDVFAAMSRILRDEVEQDAINRLR